MTDITDRLGSAYNAAMGGGVVNDHDYIASVRPRDLKDAIHQILFLREALKNVLDEYVWDETDGWPESSEVDEARELVGMGPKETDDAE